MSPLAAVRRIRPTDWLPLAAWAGGIVVLSSIPGDQLPGGAFWSADKVAHAGIFVVLGLLAARLLQALLGAAGPRLFAWTVALTSVWGALDEVHQLVTPSRSPDPRDWIADTAGGAIGALLWLWWARRRAAARIAAAPPAPGPALGPAERP